MSFSSFNGYRNEEVAINHVRARAGVCAESPPPAANVRGRRVGVDYFTKVVEAEAMKSQDAETVASTFFNRWICQHGVPESVHGDQGPNY
ncbi:hypothetical protein TSMEX_011217 [Taenia solium]|eukprot:TsM_000982400 transcript=TsM_000982400 gene=TsM_000982400